MKQNMLIYPKRIYTHALAISREHGLGGLGEAEESIYCKRSHMLNIHEYLNLFVFTLLSFKKLVIYVIADCL